MMPGYFLVKSRRSRDLDALGFFPSARYARWLVSTFGGACTVQNSHQLCLLPPF